MPFAAGPWHRPPELPDDPQTLCLVELHHAERGSSHHAMRYARHEWFFEDGSALSRTRRVVRWAYITDSVERMSQLPPPDELPHASRLFSAHHVTDHENVRLLLAYIAELKQEVAVLRARLIEATSKQDEQDARKELRQVKGELKQEKHMRAQQAESAELRIAQKNMRLDELNKELMQLRSQLSRAAKALQSSAQRH